MTGVPGDAAGRGRLEDAVIAAIRQVLHETGREPAVMGPETALAADLGLDSLDLAQTIVLLERSLGIDPFRQAPAGGSRAPVRLVGDLVAVYAGAMGGGTTAG